MAKKKSNIKQFHTNSKKSTSRPKKNSYEAKKAEIEERRKIASLEKKESARVEREKKRDEKKTQRAEKRKLDSEKVAAELIGLLFIALGLYMLICLFNISTGSLGVIIRDCMHGLLGYFAFFIPLAAIGGGVLCLTCRQKNHCVKSSSYCCSAVDIQHVSADLSLRAWPL